MSNTYYVPRDSPVPKKPHYDMEDDPDDRKMISYYQWIPLILMFQASMAFVPCLIWRFLNKRSGMNYTCGVIVAFAVEKCGGVR